MKAGEGVSLYSFFFGYRLCFAEARHTVVCASARSEASDVRWRAGRSLPSCAPRRAPPGRSTPGDKQYLLGVAQRELGGG